VITSSQIYDFVFRGLLTESALDKAGRPLKNTSGYFDEVVAQELSIDLLDEQLVASANRMAAVYTAIAAFENSVRDLVVSVLTDTFHEDWWLQGVSSDIRRRAETRKADEDKVKWHTKRGDRFINYVDMGDLAKIMLNNREAFVAYVPDVEWARDLLSTVERSRNVIMHSGDLHIEDVRRVGIQIRDWVMQVGS